MRKLIVANWKMTPQTAREAELLFRSVLDSASKFTKASIVICPPVVYLDALSRMLKSGNKQFKKNVELGAQDFFEQEGEAHTGQVSLKMLKNLGGRYFIVGHSEKRKLGETDGVISKKIKQALKNNLKILFCVGEGARDESGDYLQFIKEEIIKGLDAVPPKFFKGLAIVYEPIWAISSGGFKPKQGQYHADTAEDVFQMATYIKRVVVSFYGKGAVNIPILYGGSVDAENIGEFMAKGGVDGLLVGRTSWSAKSFRELLKRMS